MVKKKLPMCGATRVWACLVCGMLSFADLAVDEDNALGRADYYPPFSKNKQ